MNRVKDHLFKSVFNILALAIGQIFIIFIFDNYAKKYGANMKQQHSNNINKIFMVDKIFH